MSERTRRIKIKFGPFRFSLEGFETPSEGADMAAHLIRRISDYKLFPDDFDQRPDAAPRPAPTNPTTEKPLLLKEPPPAAQTAGPAPETATPEFHSQRKVFTPEPEPAPGPQATAKVAGGGKRRLWREELARLEENANQAMVALMADASSDPQGTARKIDELKADSEPDHPATAPETPAGNPDTGNGHQPAISEGMDINRRAIEQAAEVQGVNQQITNGRDYLAMEDMAIDRLLETTNALLKTDDHTRKNQSLDRQKAAVVATEAERRVRSGNGPASVTLDFDAEGSDAHTVANVLSTPYIDPEKRAKRLQDYRKMIADNKKRS